MCNGSDQAFHLVVFNRDRRRVTFVMPCIHGCRDIHSSCLALAAANTAWPNSTGLCAAAPRLGRQPRSLRMPLILMLICGLPPAVSTLIGPLSKDQSESMFRGGLLPAAPVLIECSSKYQSESMFRGGLLPAAPVLIECSSKYQSESMFRSGLLPAALVPIECSSKY